MYCHFFFLAVVSHQAFCDDVPTPSNARACCNFSPMNCCFCKHDGFSIDCEKQRAFFFKSVTSLFGICSVILFTLFK